MKFHVNFTKVFRLLCNCIINCIIYIVLKLLTNVKLNNRLKLFFACILTHKTCCQVWLWKRYFVHNRRRTNRKFEKLRKSEEHNCTREMAVYRKSAMRTLRKEQDIDFSASPAGTKSKSFPNVSTWHASILITLLESLICRAVSVERETRIDSGGWRLQEVVRLHFTRKILRRPWPCHDHGN